jgi:hypothetical protein
VAKIVVLHKLIAMQRHADIVAKVGISYRTLVMCSDDESSAMNWRLDGSNENQDVPIRVLVDLVSVNINIFIGRVG